MQLLYTKDYFPEYEISVIKGYWNHIIKLFYIKIASYYLSNIIKF